MDVNINKARIRFLRESAGIHQADLADAVGVDPRFISHIETGKRDPSVKILARIAKELNITMDELIIISEPTEAV